jgi:hypothetical protein
MRFKFQTLRRCAICYLVWCIAILPLKSDSASVCSLEMWALLPHQNQMTFSLVACTVYLFLQQSVFSFYVERSLCFEVKPQVVLQRTRCYATAGASSSSSNIHRSPRRWNQVSSLMNWAKMNGILIGDGVTIEEMPVHGLGIALSTTNSKKKGDVILEVPTKMALSVDVPRDSPSNTWISQLFETRDSSSSKNAYLESPWWVRLSLQLVALKNDIGNRMFDEHTYVVVYREEAVRLLRLLSACMQSEVVPILLNIERRSSCYYRSHF